MNIRDRVESIADQASPNFWLALFAAVVFGSLIYAWRGL